MLILTHLHSVNNTPLHLHQHAATSVRYTQLVFRLLAMLLRDPPSGLVIPSNATLTVALDELRKAPDMGSNQSIALLHKVFLGLWHHQWDSKDGNMVICPTMAFLALDGLKSNGSYKQAAESTESIARLERAIRLTMLKEIKAVAAIRYNGDELKASHDYLCWTSEKVRSPFNSLCSLKHIAYTIAHSTPARPSIHWTDPKEVTAMSFCGTPITLEHLREVVCNMEAELLLHWTNQVLLGEDLTTSYGFLHDDLQNDDIKYSFLSDLRNPCFHVRNRLIKHVFSTPSLRARFFHDKQCKTWNIPACHRWLRHYGEHQINLSARVEILTGKIRGTELTTMNYINTATRSEHNLLAMPPHLCLLRLYSKTGALSGHDQRMPHSVDALTKDLLIQDLTLARPYAELLASLCFPDDDGRVVATYREQLFVNYDREVTTADITKKLQNSTLPVIGKGFGVQDLRQICIGWERKRCGAMDRVMEEAGLETIMAASVGHTRDVDSHHYGISTDALGGQAEDITPLFLKASGDWQVEMRTIPGHISLPYKQVTSDKFNGFVESGEVMLGKWDRPDPQDAMKNNLASEIAAKITPDICKAVETQMHSILQVFQNSLMVANGGM